MIHNLDELNKKSNPKHYYSFNLQEKKKKNDKTTSSYAGGEKSGIAVEHDGKHKDLLDGTESLKPGEKTDVTITLFQNGFKINDGEFRDEKEPANKKFLSELKTK